MSTGDLTTLDKIFIWWTWPFSIQLSETVHASALYAVDLEVFKENPMECCKVSHPHEVLAIQENLLQ